MNFIFIENIHVSLISLWRQGTGFYDENKISNGCFDEKFAYFEGAITFCLEFADFWWPRKRLLNIIAS